MIIGTSSGLVCLSESNGAIEWRSGDKLDFADSSPFVDVNQAIIVVDSRGSVHKFASDGRQLWEFSLNSDLDGFRVQGVLDSDSVYLPELSYDSFLEKIFDQDSIELKVLPISPNKYLCTRFDGTQMVIDSEGVLRDVIVHVYPLVSYCNKGGAIYLQSPQGIFLAFGSTYWEFKQVWKGAVVNEPAFDDQGGMYFADFGDYSSGYSGHHYFVQNGEVIWRNTVDGYSSTPVISPDGVVYFAISEANCSTVIKYGQ